MAEQGHLRNVEEEDWAQPSKKRQRISRDDEISNDFEQCTHPNHHHGPTLSRELTGEDRRSKDKSITIASTAKLAPQMVAPFLAKHIPAQYAPLGGLNDVLPGTTSESNSKFCYRHRPDMLCRRQADEPTMDKLQRGLETLSQEDRQGIVQVWSLFSAAPSKHRNLMLQGVLAQCCFPQLSYLSANVRELIRIDFLSALPAEIAFRILCFLDTTSLCKAAQVSRKWRQLADDDVVWHRMCEQHIDRKCTKCGWGLPLLDRKRLRASKRQIQLRATGSSLNEWSPTMGPVIELPEHDGALHSESLPDNEPVSDGRLSPVAVRRPSIVTSQSEQLPKTRPWKDVYRDRFKVGTNWKYGRCSVKLLRGHTNGIMALQLYDNILATGSYDATIKIWNLDTGRELRTLTGHTMGIRCLQLDDTKLISGSLDKTLKVWNWRTGECIATYTGHREGVVGLHFDSNILVSGSIDHTARVWNFKNKSVCTLRGHRDWVNSVRIDTASRTIFTASDDCTIKLWDIDTKKCIRTFEGHVGQVQQVVLLPPEFEAEEEPEHLGDHNSDPGSPGSHHTAASSIDSIAISPVLSNSALSSTLLSSDLYHQAFSGDRPGPPRYIVTSGLDSTIRMWEVSTGRCIRTFFGHVEGVWALAGDTLRIVSGAEDRMVKIWDPRSGKCERTFTGHRGPVTCVGLSDSRMCSAGEDGEVRVYSFSD